LRQEYWKKILCVVGNSDIPTVTFITFLINRYSNRFSVNIHHAEKKSYESCGY